MIAGTEIPLDELPRYSPWPARLLGLLPWTPPRRDIAKVEREYDADKYAKCLAYFQDAPDRRAEDVKQFEFGVEPSEPVCISTGGTLRLMPLREAKRVYQDLLRDVMRPVIREDTVVVELGCGYGYNLWTLREAFPEETFVGGEYSNNAVRLAQQLYAGIEGIVVKPLNLYDARYSLLDDAGAARRLVVFTSHAIEQLPSAVQVLDTLAAYRDRICAVFHFEPVYEAHDDSLLGLMRRRYAEINDYNRDLLSVIQDHSEVRIVRLEADVLGLNPLNATSVLHWGFVT